MHKIFSNETTVFEYYGKNQKKFFSLTPVIICDTPQHGHIDLWNVNCDLFVQKPVCVLQLMIHSDTIFRVRCVILKGNRVLFYCVLTFPHFPFNSEEERLFTDRRETSFISQYLNLEKNTKIFCILCVVIWNACVGVYVFVSVCMCVLELCLFIFLTFIHS